MLTVFVCDDEQRDINIIEHEIQRYSNKSNVDFDVKSFLSPEPIIYELGEGHFADIYILDVSMPKKNGFELAEDIRKLNSSSIIIFLTSLDNMASVGYKCNALRYIVKANLLDEISEALSSAAIEARRLKGETATIQHYSDVTVIPFNEIVCVTKNSRHSLITTYSLGEFIDDRGLKDIFSDFNDKRFLFIDRSYFVNIDFISKLSQGSLFLRTGQVLPVSRRSLQAVKRRLLLLLSD